MLGKQHCRAWNCGRALSDLFAKSYWSCLQQKIQPPTAFFEQCKFLCDELLWDTEEHSGWDQDSRIQDLSPSDQFTECKLLIILVSKFSLRKIDLIMLSCGHLYRQLIIWYHLLVQYVLGGVSSQKSRITLNCTKALVIIRVLHECIVL